MVEYIYDSWGKVLSTAGTLAATLGANQPFRYRGYVYDEETGWYYLQSRYYDPTTCRFISADVYLSTGQGVLGHNAFAYCLNNPVNMADECGCAPWHLIIPDWGYIHRKVQRKIEELYGFEREHKCSSGKIDIIDKNSRFIWEVKYCGLAALGANAQQDKYLKAMDDYERGVGISSYYFETTTDGGKKIWIMYWESEPGVILYAWGKTLEEMQKDALKAAKGATAVIALFGISQYYSLIQESLLVYSFVGGFGGGGGGGTPDRLGTNLFLFDMK